MSAQVTGQELGVGEPRGRRTGQGELSLTLSPDYFLSSESSAFRLFELASVWKRCAGILLGNVSRPGDQFGENLQLNYIESSCRSLYTQ